MHPYWVTFERTAAPSLFNLGVGVTANSEDDARRIIAAAMHGSPSIASVVPVKDMRDLDQGHVANNMGNWFRRGIWFPLGYENSN